MKSKNIRHVGLVVKDVEESMFFYTNLLGFKIEKDQVETGKYIDIFLGTKNTKVRTIKMSLGPGSMVELLHFDRPLSSGDPLGLTNFGCTHVALTIDNLEETYEKLLEHDIDFVNRPHVSPDGKAKVAFCKDPNGIFLELVEEL